MISAVVMAVAAVPVMVFMPGGAENATEMKSDLEDKPWKASVPSRHQRSRNLYWLWLL